MNESLAEKIEKIGYRFTSPLENCGYHLLRLLDGKQMTPALVADVLSMMIRTHTGLPQPNIQTPMPFGAVSRPFTWDEQVFVTAVNELVPNLEWTDVLRHLDSETFEVKDREGLMILLNAFRVGVYNSYGPRFNYILVDFLYINWQHVKAQFSLLEQIINNPDIFCLGDYLIHSVDISVLYVPPKSNNVGKTWRSLDLVKLLFTFAVRGLYPRVKGILSIPILLCPDLLLLAIIQLNMPMTFAVREVLTILMPLYCSSHPNASSLAIYTLNSENVPIKKILTEYIYELYMADNIHRKNLHRVIDYAIEQKRFYDLLNADCFLMALDAACLSSWKGYLNMEHWVMYKIGEHGLEFARACIRFLICRCPHLRGIYDLKDIAELIPQDEVGIILRCLYGCANMGFPVLMNKVHEMMVFHNRMMVNRHCMPPHGVRVLLQYLPVCEMLRITIEMIDINVSVGVMEEVDGFLHRILGIVTPTLTVDELLLTLRAFENSHHIREREIHKSLLAKLYIDYRHFPGYSRGHVLILSQLLGGILQYKLVRNPQQLDIFLGLVLDALEKPTGSNMNDFGLFALDRFKIYLKYLPHFCGQVINLNHSYEFPTILMKYVHAGLLSQDPPTEGPYYT